MTDVQEDPAVTNFRRYLRIKTVQPNPNYAEATEYFKGLANELDLPYSTFETVKGKEMFIITWTGQDPSLPSVSLYSHIDVVPVFPEHWKVDPFSAEKIDGKIYARGAQDMKCVGIQYIEAIRRLKQQGKTFLRTVHIIFGPDEEIGGTEGMAIFIKSDKFKELNIGFGLDEGLANPEEKIRVFYGERSTIWVKVICSGSPGHGSAFLKNTAAEKFKNVINKFLSFRSEEETKLEIDENLRLGDVTSINLTMVQGGVQYNVVPAEMVAVFDIRIPPTVDFQKFDEQLKTWCQESGDDVQLEFVLRNDDSNITSTCTDDKWWKAFSDACNKQKISLQKEIFPAGTDGRYMRRLNLPCLGFSPMNHTPILLHDHNEYLDEKVFLRGIEIYEEIIPALANVK